MHRIVPLADAEYRKLWPGCSIERYSTRERGVHTLDKHYGIDLLIRLPNGLSATIQEKYRRAANLRYGDFTLEYYNNPQTGEEGEWFHLCADLYFYGYANESESGWLRWILFKPIDFKMAVLDGRVRLRGPYQNTQSRANFFGLPWVNMPPEWLVAQYDATEDQSANQRRLF